MAENIAGLKATTYPITIQGQCKVPYHKSLDKQIDKLLATKTDTVKRAVQQSDDKLLVSKINMVKEPVKLLRNRNAILQVDKLATKNGGEAISPQAADVVDHVLGNVTKPHHAQQSETGTTSYHRAQLLSNTDKQITETSRKDQLSNDIDDEKQFDNDSRSRYQYDSSNLSINSDEIDDIDREALEPERDSPIPDYSQKLPPTSFSSSFGAEEARLRYSLDYAHADLKERFRQYSSASLNEEEWKRRYSLPDTTKESVKHSLSHSSPTSPGSKSLSSSPLDLLRGHPGARLVDEPDYALTPRVKEGLYFCHLCSFSGTTQSDFDLHMTCHFEHVCPHCDYKSRTEGRLKRHIKDFHTDDGEFGNRTMPGRPKVFKCKQCDYSTTEKIDFWTHSRQHIKEDKLLQCPRCPFVTEYKHHLEYHLRNHFGSKPFKCPKCNYACVNKSMLNSHMKSHTNVYQYRCADCTYATKYCHSLKLHLRKYSHKPAAVLNSDGSLPQGMDATASGLSLLAKRGPPRGPRGPRKDKLDPMTNHFLQMGPSPMNRLPGLPGMMSPYWPLLHSQVPNGMQFPPIGLGPRFGPQLPPLPSPRDHPVIKKEELSSPTGSINPYKCNFCNFVGSNREVLTSHVVKIHASENHDLFSMFGISSEALLEENHNRMNALKSPLRSPRMYNPHLQLTPGGMKIKHELPEEVHKPSPNSKQELFPEKSIDHSKEQSSMPSFPFMNGKMLPPEPRDEGIDILKQMTLKFGSGPVDLKPTSSLVESPLDLTKPRYSPPSMYNQQMNSITDAQEEVRNEEEEHSSGENSNCSNDVASSPTPRKRSRKGKAFKLDTLCLKLQEKKTSEGYESEEEIVENASDVYRDEEERDDYYHKKREGGEYVYKDREESNEIDMEEVDPTESDKKEEAEKDMNGDDHEDGKAETDEEAADFKKVQQSLNLLNSQSEEVEHEDNLVIDEDGEKRGEEDKVDKPEDKGDNLEEREGMEEENVNGSVDVDVTFFNKRKSFHPAIQRGADIAWRLFGNPLLPKKELQNGITKFGQDGLEENLDSRYRIETPDCTSTPEKRVSSPDYTCPHCQIAFGDCIMYTMHMGYHGYKDPYQCNMCGDLCKDRVEFFLHIARAAHN